MSGDGSGDVAGDEGNETVNDVDACPPLHFKSSWFSRSMVATSSWQRLSLSSLSRCSRSAMVLAFVSSAPMVGSFFGMFVSTPVLFFGFQSKIFIAWGIRRVNSRKLMPRCLLSFTAQ